MFPFALSPEFVAALQFVLFILLIYFTIFSLALVIWTFRDSRRRSRSWLVHCLGALLVLTFNLPGLLLYLLIRPSDTLAQQYDRSLEEAIFLQDLDKQLACPRCKRSVQPDFLVCPHCTAQLRKACSHCGAALSALWKACPYCGTATTLPAPTPLSPVVEAIPEPASAPPLSEALS